jgi:hypothetical protein
MKLKKISWRKAKGGRCMEHLKEGYVNNELCFMIGGRAFLTDLRPINNKDNWQPPKSYSITDAEDAKRIASDLLNNLNIDEHQANLQRREDESQKTVKLLQEAE